MPDVVWIVPSRGRPENLSRLLDAAGRTCRADSAWHFGFDLDDYALDANLRVTAGHSRTVEPRRDLTGWVNAISDLYVAGVPAIGVVNDDMEPLTAGWDAMLLEALPAGGGWSYPDTLRRRDIPELPLASASVVMALGWFYLPELSHWFVDNVISVIGRGAGCIRFAPRAVVKHHHPNVTGRPGDATYYQAGEHYAADLAVWQQWKLRKSRAVIRTVERVRKAAQHPV